MCLSHPSTMMATASQLMVLLLFLEKQAYLSLETYYVLYTLEMKNGIIRYR